VAKVPTLRHLARSSADIEDLAGRLVAPMSAVFEGVAEVSVVACQSQIGSGSLPIERLNSAAVAITPNASRKGGGTLLKKIAAGFRALPIPVIGRIQDGALLMDVRCLDEEAGFVSQLTKLKF
jgi:L-seryl-tRNA(Ser) seleniumtransferase